MGKLFGKKHKYSIDTNQVRWIIQEEYGQVLQELLALGLGGSISSFFSVFPCSTSLSRSLVNEAAGAMTQVGLSFVSTLRVISGERVWEMKRRILHSILDDMNYLIHLYLENPLPFRCPVSSRPSLFSSLFSGVVLFCLLFLSVSSLQSLLSHWDHCSWRYVEIATILPSFISILLDLNPLCRYPNCPISGAFPRLIS